MALTKIIITIALTATATTSCMDDIKPHIQAIRHRIMVDPIAAAISHHQRAHAVIEHAQQSLEQSLHLTDPAFQDYYHSLSPQERKQFAQQTAYQTMLLLTQELYKQ